jgi:hypothetical protein
MFSNKGYIPTPPKSTSSHGAHGGSFSTGWGASWWDKDEYKRESTIIHTYEDAVSTDFYTEGEGWHWTLWEAYVDTMENKSKSNTKEKENQQLLEEIYDIYNNENRICGVISEDGNIIWDDDYDLFNEKYTSETGGEEDRCPNCKDTKNVAISSFNVGDSECYRCGAIFDSTTGEIYMYNLETKRTHDNVVNGVF